MSELKDLHSLERLEIAQTGSISDLSPLQGLTNLTELVLGSAGIRDLTPIEGLRNIKSLSLGGSQVSDLSPIRNFHKLQVLSLPDRVIDLNPLKGLDTVEEINVGVRQIPGPRNYGTCQSQDAHLYELDPVDLSPVGELGQLDSLSIFGPTTVNLAFLRRLGRLSELRLEPQDFSALMQWRHPCASRTAGTKKANSISNLR